MTKKEYDRLYFLAHKEQFRRYNKTYRIKHHEEISERRKKHRKQHPEIYKAYDKRYRITHWERILQYRYNYCLTRDKLYEQYLRTEFYETLNEDMFPMYLDGDVPNLYAVNIHRSQNKYFYSEEL